MTIARLIAAVVLPSPESGLVTAIVRIGRCAASASMRPRSERNCSATYESGCSSEMRRLLKSPVGSLPPRAREQPLPERRAARPAAAAGVAPARSRAASRARCSERPSGACAPPRPASGHRRLSPSLLPNPLPEPAARASPRSVSAGSRTSRAGAAPAPPAAALAAPGPRRRARGRPRPRGSAPARSPPAPAHSPAAAPRRRRR